MESGLIQFDALKHSKVTSGPSGEMFIFVKSFFQICLYRVYFLFFELIFSVVLFISSLLRLKF